MQSYCGWKIDYSSYRPVTGTWRAERFGVTLSANSLEMLKRMIDQRIQEYPSSGGA